MGVWEVWLEVSSLSLHYVETREVLPSTSEKDGTKQGEIRDAVPCEFWHGSRKLLTRGISRKTR